MTEPTSPLRELQEFAYYYPEPYWHGGRASEWVKSILLFFDGVATLTPGGSAYRAIQADESLAVPLLESGLLRQIEPRELIDHQAIVTLADIVIKYVEDNNVRNDDGPESFIPISTTRMGFHASTEVSHRLYLNLQDRGLVGPVVGSGLFLNREIRELVLCLWSQILRRPGRDLGLDLMPISDNGAYLQSLARTLGAARPDSPSMVVELDLEEVSIDLTNVPLDEILDFRRQHGSKYRAYRRDLNKQVAILSTLDEEQRTIQLRDRREELRDKANDLNRGLRIAFTPKSLGAFAMGMIGTALGIVSHNFAAAGVAAVSATWGLTKEADTAGSFSYLFEAERKWRDR